MIIPVEEIVYIVNCFEVDNQFDVEENVKVYQAKIAKVRAWLAECGTTTLAVDVATPSTQCGCLAYEGTGKLCGYCNRPPRY